MTSDFIFTSESVTEGHPDKIADQISDAVLDGLLAQDSESRVACETLVNTGMAVIAGEITTEAYVHMPDVVRSTIKKIGYDDGKLGLDWETCSVIVSIDHQSKDIAIGVDEKKNKEQGAGDQGMMFGYACDDTRDLMPMPIDLSHRLTKRLAEVRKKNILGYLGPDGKSQVTVRYENFQPVAIDAVVISSQHLASVKNKELREGIMEEVIKATLPEKLLHKGTKYHINPTSRFVKGGPLADSGLTGRKIIVDTYGGWGRHGGGAFSGKDPSKVDRSACYMARHIAKNVVAAKLAKRCEVQLAYAIGVAEPVSVMIDTFDTGIVEEQMLSKLIRELFPLRPKGIIDYLDLKRPIYSKTAAYGHFGFNTRSLPWESTKPAAKLKDMAKGLG